MKAIDPELVQKRLQEILSFTKELEEFGNISKDDFFKNSERQYAVMHVLQLAIEACLSLGNHIIARERLGVPQNYQDTFSLLEKAKVLKPEFAEEMKKMARFRNRLVHIYWEIDVPQLYEILTTRLGDFKEYAAAIRAQVK
jgi:uncharacterized protein YutE (UPF0331/DUF86 family)